jgi:uncharacterized protein YkwD
MKNSFFHHTSYPPFSSHFSGLKRSAGKKTIIKNGKSLCRFPLSLAAIFLVLLFLCAAAPIDQSMGSLGTGNWPPVSIVDLQKEIHNQINQERLRQGMAPLNWDDHLAQIAEKHSRNMASNNFFDHQSPEGFNFVHRYQEEGYTCSNQIGGMIYCGGENLLQTFLYDLIRTQNGQRYYRWVSQSKLAENSVELWMKSPSHRQNILSPNFQKEGLGIVISPEGKVYITENFC